MKRLKISVFFGFFSLSISALAEFCPALNTLASSCGNGLCQGDFGESVSSCPQDCANPNTQVFGYWARSATCPDTIIYRPDTIAETARAVRETVLNGKKVRVKSSSHSMTDLMCGQGNIISIEKLKTIDEPQTINGRETVTFDASVTFTELQEFLHARGKAIKSLVSTGYGDINILGALATGSHGSNTKGPAGVATSMQAIQVINQRGELVDYSRQTTGVNEPDKWKALMVHLGLFGPVVRGTIEIEDQYNLYSRILSFDDTQLFQEGIEATVAQCDHVWFQWYPSNSKVVLTCASRTDRPVTDPTARSIWLDPDIDAALQDPFLVLMQLGACSKATECFIETTRQDLFLSDPPLVYDGDDGNLVHLNEIVGFSHRMTTGIQENIQSIPPGYEWVFAVPSQHATDVLQYAKNRIQQDGRCLPLNALMVRFGQVHDENFLSMESEGPGFTKGEQLAIFEIPMFLPYGFSDKQLQKYFAPFFDIVDYAVDRYGARLHWGKNREDIFTKPKVLADLNGGNRLAKVQAIIDEVDPYGVFSNEFLARSGFNWPRAGQDWLPAYYPECGTQNDADGDGMTDCFELSVGSDPQQFNGLKVSIDNFFGDGSCNKMDTYSEMESRYTSPREVKNMTAGWEFNSKNHTYTKPTYNWNPAWSRSGKRTWKVRFEGMFKATVAGRYCFNVNNGSEGGGMAKGWNSCTQVWVDQQRMSEAGFNASNHAQAGCIDLESGESYKIDLVGRYHNANIGRPFLYSAKYCADESGGDCTPDKLIPQHSVTPIP